MVFNKEHTMKHVSFLILISMFGGVTVLSAQEHERESESRQQIAIARGMLPNGGGSFLGIVGEEIDDEIARKLNLPGEYGAVITEIVRGSAAADAGLQKNDVIVRYNGTRVESMAQLRRMISETPAGRNVELAIIRNGIEQTVQTELRPRFSGMNVAAFGGNGGFASADVEWNGNLVNHGNTTYLFPNGEWIGPEFANGDFALLLPEGTWSSATFENSFPDDFDEKMQERMERLQARLEKLDIEWADSGVQFNMHGPDGEFQVGFGGSGSNRAVAIANPGLYTRMLVADGHRLGATVQPLSGQLAEFFKLKDGETGVLVNEVQEGMAAESGGLQAGDVIVAIDGETVATPVDVTRLIYSKSGTVAVDVVRDGSRQKLNVNLGK